MKNGDAVRIEKMIWEYFDDDAGCVCTYHDVSYITGTELDDYIEGLFDSKQINDSEREYLLKKYVHSSSNRIVDQGVFTLRFEIPEKNRSEPTPSSSKKMPPPPPKQKASLQPNLISVTPEKPKPIKSIAMPEISYGEGPEPDVKPTPSGRPKPPPPPPPRPRVRPVPPAPTPGPSPEPKRLFRYQIPVHCTQNSKKWNCMVQSEEKPKQFEQVPAQQGANIEISFLIDTSGSMSDEMEAVKRSCIEFARIIEEKGVNVRLALTGYGIEYGDDYSTQTWQLSDAKSFQHTVNEHLFIGLCGGGGCYVAEAGTARVFDEVISVFSSGKGGKMSDVTRYIVHISDEYDYSGGNYDMKSIIDSCKKADVIVHTMGCNQPGHTEISRQTGGEFWDIENTHGEADLSGILENVSQNIANSVSLNQNVSKVSIDGPQCTQYNSSMIATGGGTGGRSSTNLLKENEGYVAIREFICMYCDKDLYFVCNFCGEHNCRGTETPVNDPTSDVVAQALCQSCGKNVRIVEQDSVDSNVGQGSGGKKGK